MSGLVSPCRELLACARVLVRISPLHPSPLCPFVFFTLSLLTPFAPLTLYPFIPLPLYPYPFTPLPLYPLPFCPLTPSPIRLFARSVQLLTLWSFPSFEHLCLPPVHSLPSLPLLPWPLPAFLLFLLDPTHRGELPTQNSYSHRVPPCCGTPCRWRCVSEPVAHERGCIEGRSQRLRRSDAKRRRRQRKSTDLHRGRSVCPLCWSERGRRKHEGAVATEATNENGWQIGRAGDLTTALACLSAATITQRCS
jgi:hypothetical protein